MILDNINFPKDLKGLSGVELEQLCEEIRKALIEKMSREGGHIGSNLGVIEMTVALHFVFDCPHDKVVFDVSHQTYSHKLLTGRKEFLQPGSKISGFSNFKESAYDIFSLGHTSSSISLACGLMKARAVKGGKENIIAIIGDGALSGGLAYEGLNNVIEQGGNAIIIINDNEMSIAENKGGIYKNLSLLRKMNGKCQQNLFRDLGFKYYYLEKGNDVKSLVKLFQKVINCDKPTILHIHTIKGKGLDFAERDKEVWHRSGAFTLDGQQLQANNFSYSTFTGDYLLSKMREDKNVVTIISGTPSVISFDKEKRQSAGEQFVDVGICEPHAVAFASAVAKAGAKSVYCVYSSFIQRSYDQISQEVCLNESGATILLFGGGVYGYNDSSHLGFFDIALLSNIPNLLYLSPSSFEEYQNMLQQAVSTQHKPLVIRVPTIYRRKICAEMFDMNKPHYVVEHFGKRVALLGLGNFYWLANEIYQDLKEKNIDATLINPLFVGIDEGVLSMLAKSHKVVVTIEDGIIEGGFGQKIVSYLGKFDIKVLNYGIKKEFCDRFTVENILRDNGLVKENIVTQILKEL